ncbi:hypothetical protein LAZ40_06800 [Cereibacter sphaeroides]|uniref:hypothetical protein n=1 Tax=Cereibacter sphaeroides TaxID=1063 RepID=UPI001F4656BD|nr:hypothetical protein [Cereibacter sphaeroides]MCE6958755.1 hypothetical protein [Cereibacter sphaeroides]MCE6973371.1 hypothetical protein [Cereibacter sphaeroides]
MPVSFPLIVRFRPERRADFLKLRRSFDAEDRGLFRDVNRGTQDGEATVDYTARSPRALNLLLLLIFEVDDGQEMVRTLDLAEHYTGDARHGAKERALRILDALGRTPDSLRKSVRIKARAQAASFDDYLLDLLESEVVAPDPVQLSFPWT